MIITNTKIACVRAFKIIKVKKIKKIALDQTLYLFTQLFEIKTIMRPLTEEETKTFFEKLSKYIGENIKQLIDRSDGTYCFRLHRERVYYVSERIMKQVWHDYILFILRVLLNRSSFNYKIRTGLHVLVESTEFINFFCFIKK